MSIFGWPYPYVYWCTPSFLRFSAAVPHYREDTVGREVIGQIGGCSFRHKTLIHSQRAGKQLILELVNKSQTSGLT